MAARMSVTPLFHGTRRFEVRRHLGTGGMGVVFEAWDRERRVPVALKMLARLDGDALLRIKGEFRTLADLHHANLVELGELFEDGGRWFFTMELVEGVSFLRWVRPGAELDDPDGLEVRGETRQTGPDTL